ncbi:DNA helicase [Tanacetum coccineum]
MVEGDKHDNTSSSASVREQGNVSLQCPKLTEINYTTWALLMETILKAYGILEMIVAKEGEATNEKKENTSKAMIFQTLPQDFLMQVAQYSTAKEFKGLGETLEDKVLVRKLLNSVPKTLVPAVALDIFSNTPSQQPALVSQECIPPSAIGRQPPCDPMSDVVVSGGSAALHTHFQDTMNVIHPHIPSNSRAALGSQQLSTPVRSPRVREVPNVNNQARARRDHTRRGSIVGDENLSSQVRALGLPVGYKHLEGCDYSCQHYGALFWYEEGIKNNPRGAHPRYNGCCKGGRVVLPTYEIYPEYKKTLLEDRHFLENIRAYNQMFSMTSLGARVDESINNGRGPYMFKISAHEKFEDTNIPNFKVRLYNVIGAREYELPTGDMLGAIVYEAGPEANMDYDIVLEERSGHPQRVHKLHPSYRSLQFPFLFLYGEDGYQKEMKMVGSNGSSSQQKRLNMLAYYSYYLHDHANRYNYLSRTRRLFQQYVMTAFCMVEQNRIDFIREHQNDIRNEYLLGIYDVINRGDNNGSDCGSRLILPQSFTGGPRYMYSHYLDALIYWGENSVLQRDIVKGLIDLLDTHNALNRIDFIREHQNDIRNEYLSGIFDAINRGDNNGSDCGSRLILPQLFTGGPRYMYSHYLDALTVCRVHGNLSCFITFTYNVKWPEITDYMAQFLLLTTTDRADVVDRVFEIKIH